MFAERRISTFWNRAFLIDDVVNALEHEGWVVVMLAHREVQEGNADANDGQGFKTLACGPVRHSILGEISAGYEMQWTLKRQI